MDIGDVGKVNDRCTTWGKKRDRKTGSLTKSTDSETKRSQKDNSPKSKQPSTTTEDTQKHSVHLVHKDELIQQKVQLFRSRLKNNEANVCHCRLQKKPFEGVVRSYRLWLQPNCASQREEQNQAARLQWRASPIVLVGYFAHLFGFVHVIFFLGDELARVILPQWGRGQQDKPAGVDQRHSHHNDGQAGDTAIEFKRKLHILLFSSFVFFCPVTHRTIAPWTVTLGESKALILLQKIESATRLCRRIKTSIFLLPVQRFRVKSLYIICWTLNDLRTTHFFWNVGG